MDMPNILIVEDEPIVAEDIASRLRKMGYGVLETVESGEEAIQVATEFHPDLVLMDIVLEGELDGIQTAQQIYDRLHIPIVYLTANADEITLQRAKVTKPFGYILKPFKDKELRATIEIAISRHQVDLEVQQTLVIAQQQQQQQNHRQDEYLMMASHELRTPLSIVKVATSLIRERGYSMTEAERQQNLNHISTAVDSMSLLIEDVLTLGKIGDYKTTFNPACFDLITFCENLIEATQWSVGNQYTLTFAAEGDCSNVYLDEKLVWHLLTNLLSNAIKYSPPETKVALTISCDRASVNIQVQDQGIGIPPEDQQSLFEPFQRARNVGTVPGTGLGLAIVKRAVDLHGGHISLESEVGKGTIVRVSLPCACSCPST